MALGIFSTQLHAVPVGRIQFADLAPKWACGPRVLLSGARLANELVQDIGMVMARLSWACLGFRFGVLIAVSQTR